MSAYYVLSLFAPYLTFIFFLYKKLDVSSAVIYILSFDLCFVLSVLATPFYGVISGVLLYMILILAKKTKNYITNISKSI